MSSYIFQNKNILVNNSKMDLIFFILSGIPGKSIPVQTVAKIIDSGGILRATAYVQLRSTEDQPFFYQNIKTNVTYCNSARKKC
jgi:hypothetical protein